MTSSLLQTKLHIPPSRPTLLPRARLVSRLDAAPGIVLALVSAPAGFGKTTLLSEWATRTPEARRRTAWVSLDSRDNDPTTFWSYVVAALQTVVPGAGEAGGVESLLNDLHTVDQQVWLVLDDYHVIASAAVHDEMAFLVEHLPPHVHVVLSTRADPPLPLARLRARQQLVELRASDLRFTAEEAAAYLRDSMGLVLDERAIAALDSRTEGWVAALQLAALSMQGRQDLSGFVAEFTGDDRYIVDYLAEEVLQRLPGDLRSFLLRTSILTRFNGALCDAVTQQPGGRAALESLDRQNLFVVPLDDSRRWYRYHHLFADVLRARLLDEEPDAVSGLHLRASEWHESSGDLAEAVHHAVAGQQWLRAADLIQRAVPELRRERREATLRHWLDALPEQLVLERPVLAISYVGSLMSIGQVEAVDRHLKAVEDWLDRPGGTDAALASTDPLVRTLPGTVAMYQAGRARLRGDVEGTVQHATRARDLAGEHDHLERGAAEALLGLAHWSRGDLRTATRHYVESLDRMARAGHVADSLGCTIALADLELAQGRLQNAVDAYRRGLAAAEQQPVAPRGTADMHTGLATLLLERNQLDEAAEHLRAAAALGEAGALAQNAYRWRLAMATTRQVQGDLLGAEELLVEAELVYDSDYSPDVRPVAAVRARLHLVQGRIEEALAWTRSRQLSAADEMSYLREYEHLTLARVLLHQARPDPQVDDLLGRLLTATEAGGRSGSVIDVLLLQARAAAARRDTTRALERLRRALELAEPQGYVRTVLDHGPAVVELLRLLAREPGSYVPHLLSAVGVVPAQRTGGPDRLSEREVEVLRLLASDLDGPGIARTLVVSVNTVRTHTKSIYAKLGVNSRLAAVHRAQDLGLLVRR